MDSLDKSMKLLKIELKNMLSIKLKHMRKMLMINNKKLEKIKLNLTKTLQKHINKPFGRSKILKTLWKKESVNIK